MSCIRILHKFGFWVRQWVVNKMTRILVNVRIVIASFNLFGRFSTFFTSSLVFFCFKHVYTRSLTLTALLLDFFCCFVKKLFKCTAFVLYKKIYNTKFGNLLFLLWLKILTLKSILGTRIRKNILHQKNKKNKKNEKNMGKTSTEVHF